MEIGASSPNGVMRLSGELNIHHAGRLREALREAFATGEALSLDLEGVTEVDIACLQVLCTAHRTFRASNRVLQTIGRSATAFEQAVDDSGYRRKAGCHDGPRHDCLWVRKGAA